MINETLNEGLYVLLGGINRPTPCGEEKSEMISFEIHYLYETIGKRHL